MTKPRSVFGTNPKARAGWPISLKLALATSRAKVDDRQSCRECSTFLIRLLSPPDNRGEKKIIDFCRFLFRFHPLHIHTKATTWKSNTTKHTMMKTVPVRTEKKPAKIAEMNFCGGWSSESPRWPRANENDKKIGWYPHKDVWARPINQMMPVWQCSCGYNMGCCGIWRFLGQSASCRIGRNRS